MVKASDTGGVKPMRLGTRLISERERCIGMTEEERLYRKQYLKDLELSPNEPRPVPEMYKFFYNPIRRLYRAPLEAMQVAITPILGAKRAYTVRYFTGKFAIGLFATYCAAYYFKYNANDWTRTGGWSVSHAKQSCFEGEEGYPFVPNKKPHEYADRGFNSVTLNL